jgi:hypothetical protein
LSNTILYLSADIEMFSRHSPYPKDILHHPDGVLPARPASNPLLEFSSLLDWGDEGRYPLGSIVTEELAKDEGSRNLEVGESETIL